jgi:hypothetical protein
MTKKGITSRSVPFGSTSPQQPTREVTSARRHPVCSRWAAYLPDPETDLFRRLRERHEDLYRRRMVNTSIIIPVIARPPWRHQNLAQAHMVEGLRYWRPPLLRLPPLM